MICKYTNKCIGVADSLEVTEQLQFGFDALHVHIIQLNYVLNGCPLGSTYYLLLTLGFLLEILSLTQKHVILLLSLQIHLL